MYRPGEKPVDGACPVRRCKLPELKRNRADHVHACPRNEFAVRAAGKQPTHSASALVRGEVSTAGNALSWLYLADTPPK